MFNLKRLRECIKTGRHRGMSITEVLIAMIVLGVVLWAIMTTVATSTELQISARSNMNARMLANSWFGVFECIDPEEPDPLPPAGTFMRESANYVAGILDASYTGIYPNYVIKGYAVRVAGDDYGATTNGVRNVTLDIQITGTRGVLSFTRMINAISHETVRDGRRRDG